MQTGSNRPIPAQSGGVERALRDSGVGVGVGVGVVGALRLVVTLALAAGALIALARWVRDLWQVVAAPGPASAPELLMAGVAALALLIGGWLWITMLLESLSLLPGLAGRMLRPLAAAVVPQIARRSVAVALGIGLAAGGGGMAHASTPSPAPAATSSAAPLQSPSASPSSPSSSGSPSPVPASPTPSAVQPSASATVPAGSTGPAGASGPGWRPTAPTVRPQTGPDLRQASGSTPGTPSPGWTPSRSSADRPSGEVVVLRGDTLWSIAAAHLGAGASDAEIAAEWPRWYAANADLIGPDPNVIRPGQVLVPPTGGSR